MKLTESLLDFIMENSYEVEGGVYWLPKDRDVWDVIYMYVDKYCAITKSAFDHLRNHGMSGAELTRVNMIVRKSKVVSRLLESLSLIGVKITVGSYKRIDIIWSDELVDQPGLYFKEQKLRDSLDRLGRSLQFLINRAKRLGIRV